MATIRHELGRCGCTPQFLFVWGLILLSQAGHHPRNIFHHWQPVSSHRSCLHHAINPIIENQRT